jgi:hypothetical protein
MGKTLPTSHHVSDILLGVCKDLSLSVDISIDLKHQPCET